MMEHPQRTLVLYGRAGCHLCEDALALLRRLALRYGLSVQDVDIDTDALLLGRYHTSVPVITLDGAEIARAPIDPAALERRLRTYPRPLP